MITVYGIPNCDTVKKARVWLEKRGAAYRFHDFRKDGLDAATAAAWIAELGLDRVVNRKGTTWRKLDPQVQASLDEANAPALLTEQPSLVKRPVFDLGEVRLIGFDKTVEGELDRRLG